MRPLPPRRGRLTLRAPPQVIGNKWDTYLDLLQADYSEWCARLAASHGLQARAAASPNIAAAAAGCRAAAAHSRRRRSAPLDARTVRAARPFFAPP